MNGGIDPGELRVIPMEAGHVRALIDGDSAFEDQFGWKPAPGWLEFPEVLPIWAASFEDGTANEEWPSFLVVYAPTGELIGGCGYSGGPIEGQVEIGYGVARDYRSRGVATELVRQLCQFARESGEVTSIVAHTQIGENSSVAVLKKSGFSLIGEVQHADDGAVWRWQRWVL